MLFRSDKENEGRLWVDRGADTCGVRGKMMIGRDNRSAEFKIRLFRECFSGLPHVYGTYDPASGRSWQVKRAVTDEVVLRHLTGKEPCGVYLLIGHVTRAVVADFDQDDAMAPWEFVMKAEHYGLSAYIEVSKKKGFHVWTFLAPQGVSAAKARAVFRHILGEVECPDTEIFPKQDRLDGTPGNCGNFINTPLYGPLVAKGRTVFLDPRNGLAPFPNQWAFLDGIKRVTEQELDEIIEANEIALNDHNTPKPPAVLGTFQSASGLPPCARRMLEEGVSLHQRVSCFRLAVHLRKMGLPFDIVVATLSAWAHKNHPSDGRRIITGDEIKAQTSAAFLKEYRGCGCSDPAVMPYCDTSCAIHSCDNQS